MTNPATEEKLRKLASVDRSKSEAAWRLFLSGEGHERNETDNLIDVALFHEIGKDYREKVLLKPPDWRLCDGTYRLGTVLYPHRAPFASFGLREDEWIKHMLVTGMTGAGKTNLAFHLLEQLAFHNKPFLIFDWKRNYRDLKQLPAFSELSVFTVGRAAKRFSFNPLLPPPGCEPGHWLMLLVDVLKHAYFVGEGVEYLLREGIDWVYDKCGLFDESPTETPTFSRVLDYVTKKPLRGRMSLWKASALRVLESLCFRHGLGPVLNVSENFDHQSFFASNVVLELDALSDVDKVFLTEALILWLYELRKSEGKRETFKHALLIEEGHHALSEKKELAEGTETIMETCLRQIREFGEAVIVIDQEPSKLSNSIKANTYTKMTFALGNGRDVKDMSTCMCLNEEEERAMDLLDVGHAIVSMKGRIQGPIHVSFPKSRIQKGFVRDRDLGRGNPRKENARLYDTLR